MCNAKERSEKLKILASFLIFVNMMTCAEMKCQLFFSFDCRKCEDRCNIICDVDLARKIEPLSRLICEYCKFVHGYSFLRATGRLQESISFECLNCEKSIVLQQNQFELVNDHGYFLILPEKVKCENCSYVMELKVEVPNV